MVSGTGSPAQRAVRPPADVERDALLDANAPLTHAELTDITAQTSSSHLNIEVAAELPHAELGIRQLENTFWQSLDVIPQVTT
jgi:hypothetical protein